MATDERIEKLEKEITTIKEHLYSTIQVQLKIGQQIGMSNEEIKKIIEDGAVEREYAILF